jgi:two-component system, response regulator
MSASAGKFVLLVEDNQDHALLTRRAFEKNHMGERLRIVRDGLEALDFLLNDSDKPTLVLLDLDMPRMDGLEVLRRMRADPRTRSLPVVMLSSSNEQVDQRNAIQLGLQGYIRKPVDFSEFVEIVRELGLYWLQMDHPVPPGKGSQR